MRGRWMNARGCLSAFGCVWVFLHAVAPAWTEEPTKGAGDMEPIRVMSFNIRYGTANDGDNHWERRKDFLMETIRAFDPDLLGTQETLAEQKQYLLEHLPGYIAVGVGRDDGKEKGEMAALFLRSARFEKLAEGHFWLSESPETVGSKGWDAALPRIATWVQLKDLKATRADGNKPSTLLFLNTHFDHRGKEAREQSALLIRNRVPKLAMGASWIVTGDFNASPAEGPYKNLFGAEDQNDPVLVDTYRSMHPSAVPDEGTFSGFLASQTQGPRIDWIGCSPDFQVLDARIDRTQKDGRTPSDHFPVTAILCHP